MPESGRQQVRSKIQSVADYAKTRRLKKQTTERMEINMDKLKTWENFISEEDGMGTVEIILIIVVLVGLVIIFKDRITELVENIFNKITKETNKI